MRRTATEDTTIGDVSICAADKVGLFYAATKRDPSVFDHPDEIILDRSPNPHVAFGAAGPHFCLGSHFARIEIAAVFRQILTRLQNLELTEEPVWLPSNVTCEPQRAAIRFTPSPKGRRRQLAERSARIGREERPSAPR